MSEISGDLVDNLVADIIDHAGKHVKVAQDAIERLTTQYPELTDRYGDWSLGISFSNVPVRREVHKALRAKGMSVRQIAATTGATKSTVNRDLQPEPTVPDGTPASTPTVPDGTPQPPEDDAPEAEPAGEVELPPVPARKPVRAPSAPMENPRPEVKALLRSMRLAALTIEERKMLNEAMSAL